MRPECRIVTSRLQKVENCKCRFSRARRFRLQSSLREPSTDAQGYFCFRFAPRKVRSSRGAENFWVGRIAISCTVSAHPSTGSNKAHAPLACAKQLHSPFPLAPPRPKGNRQLCTPPNVLHPNRAPGAEKATSGEIVDLTQRIFYFVGRSPELDTNASNGRKFIKRAQWLRRRASDNL